MSAPEPKPFSELTPAELEAKLKEEGIALSVEQLHLIKNFADSVGGVKRARGLLKHLHQSIRS